MVVLFYSPAEGWGHIAFHCDATSIRVLLRPIVVTFVTSLTCLCLHSNFLAHLLQLPQCWYWCQLKFLLKSSKGHIF